MQAACRSRQECSSETEKLSGEECPPRKREQIGRERGRRRVMRMSARLRVENELFGTFGRRRHNRCLSGLLGAIALMTSLSIQAAGHCYVAQPVHDVNGKQLPIAPVCRSLEANMNEFCDEPPLMCGIKIAP